MTHLLTQQISKTMKINIKHILFGFTCALSLVSCEFLDYNEKSYLTEEKVFNDFNRTKNFLNDIYGRLPADFGYIDGAIRGAGVDEAEHLYTTSNIQVFNDGTWSASNTIDARWSEYYQAIRAANKFIINTAAQTFEEERYNDNYPEMMKQFNNYPFEARFLRAYFYFELAKRYGNIPLYTDVMNEEEANTIGKSTFNDVIDFIATECSEIADTLPESYATIPGGETGRATKGAALALKARALVYAASPLHNPTGDVAKWKAAASAAKAVLDMNYTLDPVYGDVVNNRASTELIFECRQGNSRNFEVNNFPVGVQGGKTSTCPSQNLIDAYEMLNGEAFDWNNPLHANTPYVNRDPRLAQTVLYDGSIWKGSPIQVVKGGRNAPPLSTATATGYYLKKYVIESIDIPPHLTPTQKEHVWVIFRLGEMYLNYAEAMNEAYGPELDTDNLGLNALTAVNTIRQRAGMPDFANGMTQDEFRTKLRNERRVELAFEDHRFWDVRRWDIGNETTDIYGVKVEQDNFGIKTYTKVLVERRTYDKKMNLYPIPQQELFVNDNLLPQNDGWE